MASLKESSIERRRPALTRERILASALELIDRDGLESLSMRRLGAELGVEAMSLYNHIPSKEALLDGVLELILGEVELPGANPSDWGAALAGAFGSFRKVLLEHPNALSLVTNKPEVTPAIFKPIEMSLSILRGAGFGPEMALQAHWAIVGFTLGHVGFQVGSPYHDEEHMQEEIEMRRAALPAEEFPTLFEVMPYAMNCDFDAAYEFGLASLIEGLRAELARSTK